MLASNIFFPMSLIKTIGHFPLAVWKDYIKVLIYLILENITFDLSWNKHNRKLYFTFQEVNLNFFFSSGQLISKENALQNIQETPCNYILINVKMSVVFESSTK